MTLVGCATASSPTAPVNPLPNEVRTVELPQVVRVSLKKWSGGNLFVFEVINFGQQPILIDRNAVELVLKDGTRKHRLPGGAADAYTVRTAEVQEVNAKFELPDNSQAEPIQLDFSRALLISGRPTPIQPLTLILGPSAY